MTHNPSRKRFVARMLGAVAAASALPAVSAQAAVAAASGAAKTSSEGQGTLKVRHDARAVARRDTI